LLIALAYGRKVKEFKAEAPPFPVFEQHFHSFLLQHQESPTFNLTNYADYYFDGINYKVREDYYEDDILTQSDICHFGANGCGGVGWSACFTFDSESKDETNETCSVGAISSDICQGVFGVDGSAIYAGTHRFPEFTELTYKWSIISENCTENYYVFYLDYLNVAVPYQIEAITPDYYSYNRFLTYFPYPIEAAVFNPYSFCAK